MSPAEGSTEDVESVRCSFACEASAVAWVVSEATITEALNEPYQLALTLQTSEMDADASEMLGESCTVTLERDEIVTEYPAIVHRMEDSKSDPDDQRYQVTIEAAAALFLLSQNRQTRIFQELTVPEILDQVLGEGLDAYGRKHQVDLARDYPTCEYRVQYDESDLAFCERLMEEEGITYWFDRSRTEEVLCLTDDPHASVDVETREGNTEVVFSGHGGTRECVQRIGRMLAMRPTKLSMRCFDWTSPSMPIEEEKEGQAQGDEVDGAALGPLREIYLHDRLPPTLSDYSESDGYGATDAKDQCVIRRELDESNKIVLHGLSTALGFTAGGGFELLEHPLEDEFVLTAVSHTFSAHDGYADYSNDFSCRPTTEPYRPPRLTPKPRVFGFETATVVGPPGQEIHTDKHGRIKVQFHWDREGTQDDRSSCFIRVVQPWAGAGWGFVFIPRIGMEVTVAFVQGDPDRPIVTGTVYNGDNLTSYEMPGEMTKSTIRTQSSPGGDGYNELSFEDKAGEEQVFLQAQKDLLETIKNDHDETVGNDHTADVGNDESTSVGNDQSLQVGNNQSTSVGNDQSLDVGANQSISVGGDKTVSVTGNFSESVDKDHTQSVTGSTSESVGKDRNLTVGDNWASEAGKDLTMRSGKNTALEAGNDMMIQVAKDYALGVGKKGAIKVADELTITVGSASITMKKSGDITIKGAKINIKGQSDVVIKGSKTSIN